MMMLLPASTMIDNNPLILLHFVKEIECTIAQMNAFFSNLNSANLA